MAFNHARPARKTVSPGNCPTWHITLSACHLCCATPSLCMDVRPPWHPCTAMVQSQSSHHITSNKAPCCAGPIKSPHPTEHHVTGSQAHEEGAESEEEAPAKGPRPMLRALSRMAVPLLQRHTWRW